MANIGLRKRDRAATDFIDTSVEQANNVRKEYEPQWYENWSNYRVEGLNVDNRETKSSLAVHGVGHGYGGYGSSGLSPVNFLKTPESHQGVNTLRALLLSSLYGVRDYVQADPVGDEDVEAAKRVSGLIMYGLERPGNFRTNFETLGDSLIYGLGSFSSRWRRDLRLVPRRFPVPDPSSPGQPLTDPQTGAIMTVLQNVEVPVFDDVTMDTDDLFDTWFDPSANRFQDAQFKVKRFKMRDEELSNLRDNPNWDSVGIDRVLKDPPDLENRATGPDRTDNPKLLTENLTLEDVKDITKYGYYGGWMFEGMIPKDVADEINEGRQNDRIDHRGAVVLRIISGVVVQAIQSPQRNGQIQGGSITILPTGRGIYGISPLTIVRYLQDVSDTQLILTTQALIESVYQNYLVGGDVGPGFAHNLETRRPREVFTMQSEIDQVAPLPKDYTGLQISVGALNLISQTIRQAMNARDPVAGQLSQGDTTATESQLVTTAALNNTDQLAILIERDELPTMGRLINDLYYINLDDEAKVFRRVGETATTQVNYFDIDATSDIHFVGARSVLNRAQKGNQFRDFISILASNPLTAAATDWNELVRRYGDEVLDIKGLETLLIQDPEEIVARMQALGLANTIGGNQGGNAPAKKGPSGGKTGGNTPAQAAGSSS